MWLLIWWPLEAYMVVNFRAREISRGARKLVRTPTLNYKKEKKERKLYGREADDHLLQRWWEHSCFILWHGNTRTIFIEVSEIGTRTWVKLSDLQLEGSRIHALSNLNKQVHMEPRSINQGRKREDSQHLSMFCFFPSSSSKMTSLFLFYWNGS
jgi:hypothetical protein